MKTRGIILLILLIISINQLRGQDIKIDKLDYSSGIYNTKEDFINKNVNPNIELEIEKINLIIETDSLIRRCFFFEKENHKKIKKAFAISFNGQLYFRVGAILKNRGENKESLSAPSKSAFVLVTKGGNQFLYCEAGLINPWSTGLSVGVSNGIGGMAGYVIGEQIEKAYPATTVFGTGLVWDKEKNKFVVFSSCDKFNDFISGFNIDKLNCERDFINLFEIREKIEIIK